jgi:FkbM family methyltransferase
VTRQVRDLLKPGDTFLDIGANIGYFTLLAAALVGPQGKVIAFEPRADNCKLLQDSIAENGFRNIDLHPYAVAEREQTFVIDASGANTNGRIVDYSPASTAIEVPPHLVKAVTLDGFLAEVADIDLIKMDIEGAEPRAWQGMQGVVQRYRPAIITEFSPSLIQLTSHATAESFLDLIHAQGYEIFILHRTRAKDSVPAGKETILQTLADSGLTHLDLLALPAAG